MIPYYKDDYVTQYHGHVLDVLKQMESNSVQCCVTSPPYWGLRDYGLEPQIWDGDSDCEHEWVDNTYVRNNDKTAGEKQRTNIGAVGRDDPVKNAFCLRCGAWRGSLGLEPTPDCGRPFMELKPDLTEKEREYVMDELKKAGLI